MEVLPIVGRLNRILEEHPLKSFSTHIGTSLGTFSIAFLALQVVGFDSPALAIAGVVSRLTKRLRTPLDLSIAAAVAHKFPSSNQLKLGPLLAAPLGMGSKQQRQAAKEMNLVEERIVSFVSWAQGPVNLYGGPYMLVHWTTGILTVSATTAAVHNGLDVMVLLKSLPFISASSDGTLQIISGSASCVGGAMVLNTLTLPFRLILLANYGHVAFELLDRSQEEFNRQFRSYYRRKRKHHSFRASNSH